MTLKNGITNPKETPLQSIQRLTNLRELQCVPKKMSMCKKKKKIKGGREVEGGTEVEPTPI